MLDALLDDWATTLGMNTSASRVLLSGTSAGGLAVYLHADRIRARLSGASSVHAAPDAGFFQDLPDIHGAYSWRAALLGGLQVWNGSGHVNAACLAAMPAADDQWRCAFPNYVLPHVTTVPFFVLNSLYDSFGLGNIFKLGCTPVCCIFHLNPSHRQTAFHRGGV